MADAGTARFYEVRCPDCETSFPPEARRCLHCGRRLGGLLRGPAGASAAGSLSERPPPSEAGEGAADALRVREGARPGPLPAAEDEEELEGRSSSGMLWVATALLAVLGSALRICQGA